MIPLSAPSFHGNEKKYLSECIDEGWVASGSFISRFEKSLSEYTSIPYVVACSNGTSALEIALRVLDIQEHDEVIVPTLTFIATVNSILYCGAKPIFMDCGNDCNLSIEKTISFIKNNTTYKNGFTYNIKTKKIIKAIIVVHVFGNSIQFNELLKVCEKNNIKIVEDAAESLGTFNNEKESKKHTGSIGDIGCFSFNGNKTITTGGGGAIVSHSQTLIDKARYLINQAKDDSTFYIHNQVGFNYRLSNVHAAIGLAQMESLEKVLAKKKNIYNIYSKFLNSFEKACLIAPPHFSESNFWLNVVRIDAPDLNIRGLVDFMHDSGIEVRPIWHANHLQKPFSSYESFQIDNAPRIISSSICLPSSFSLSEDQQSFIIKKLQDFIL